MPNPWPQDEIDFLTQHYADNYAEDLAIAMQRSIRSVYQKAHELGLHKSKHFLRQQIEPLLNGGFSHRFKKGQISHNKGKPMPAHVREKVSVTFFKTGHIPHNARPEGDGALSKRSGYWWIRLSLGKWRQLHTHTWEQANRPIDPKKEMIKFRDGNKDNCALENLYLVDRRQNMLENTIHRYPAEMKEAMRTLAQLKKQIKKNEKQDPRRSQPTD